MKNTVQIEWFFLIIVIIIILILSLFSLIVWNITNLDLYFIDNQSEHIISQNKNINNKNMISKFHNTINTDWFWQDITSCSGGVIKYEFEQLPICQWGEVVNISNNIDDIWDNDDFTASFYTGNILSLVSNDSDLFDNDDFARKYLIGIIPPESKQTILFLNTEWMQFVSLNPNNISDYQNTPKVPHNIQSLTLFWELSHTNGDIEVFTFDKEIFHNQKELQLISQNTWAINSTSGSLSSWANIDSTSLPFLFQVHNFDYAIVIENTSTTEVLTYQFEWFDEQNNPVYIVWLDDKNGFEWRNFLFQELIENYYGYVIKKFN